MSQLEAISYQLSAKSKTLGTLMKMHPEGVKLIADS